MILASNGIIASQIATTDADALAFFNRVTTAGGSLSTTEKNAVNQLVLDLKSYSIWTKMKVIYPMVGASAAACAQNLKSSSFTGTFNGGWTYASTGATPNGTSGYMNTGFNANSNLSTTNCHLSFYHANASGSGDRIHGIFASQGFAIDLWGSNNVNGYIGSASSSNATATNKNSFYLLTAPSSTAKVFRNTTQVVSFTTAGTMPNLNVYFGAANDGTNAQYFSNGELRFSSLGDGLSDTEASNFYTAVQTFNTTLSRQV